MESRGSNRLPVPQTIRARIRPAPSSSFRLSRKEVGGRISDISTSGVGVLTRYFIPKGAKIFVEFQLAGTRFVAEGEVRSAVAAGKSIIRLGIAFCALSSAEQAHIAQFVRVNAGKLRSPFDGLKGPQR